VDAGGSKDADDELALELEDWVVGWDEELGAIEVVEVEDVVGFGRDVKVVLEVVGASTLLLDELDAEVALVLEVLDVDVGGGGAVDEGGSEELECSDVLVDVDLDADLVLGSVTVSVSVVSVVVVGSSGGEIL
jgi:hypothetical protein